jgi:hypothetical protein
MNEQAQRIAIAQELGWKPDDDGDGTGWKGSWIHQRLIGCKPTFHKGKVVSYLIEQTVPDYLNDLNAMREVEKLLIGDDPKVEVRRVDYCLWLTMLISAAKQGGAVSEFDKLHATARQRAEAFLRAIGKWKNNKNKNSEKHENGS